MTNVADRLLKPTRRVPWIVGGVAGVGIAVAAVIAGPSIAANLNPSPSPSASPSDYVAVLTPAELDSVQQAADDQQAKIAADAAAAKAAADAQAAADAAAAAKATHQSSSSGGHPYCPSGTSMTQGDANGDPEFCLPDTCFGASPGPDCTTPIAAIKP